MNRYSLENPSNTAQTAIQQCLYETIFYQKLGWHWFALSSDQDIHGSQRMNQRLCCKPFSAQFNDLLVVFNLYLDHNRRQNISVKYVWRGRKKNKREPLNRLENVFVTSKCRVCGWDVVMMEAVWIWECPATTLFEAKCEMGFKSLLPQAVTLLMEASESHERGRLIGLAQMLQIS